MTKFIAKSLTDIDQLAEKILVGLSKKQTRQFGRATVLLLVGDLGSGKTTFTQALAAKMGVIDRPTSPTFVLFKKYQTKHPFFKNLVHLDAYRLEVGQDLRLLGWDELAADPSNLLVLEWPERVADLFNGQEDKLSFKFIDEQTREITSTL